MLTNNQELIVFLPAFVAVIFLCDRKLARDLALTILPVAVFITQLFQYSLWLKFPKVWNGPLLLAFSIPFCIGIIFAICTGNLGSDWKSALLCNTFFLIGLSLYLYLPLVSMSNPPVNWGYPRTVDGFFNVIFRGQYERVAPTTDLLRFGHQLWMLFKLCGQEMGWIYLAIALFPTIKILTLNRLLKKWIIALWIALAGVGLVVLAELNPADFTTINNLSSYFITVFAVISILAGLGLILAALSLISIRERVGKMPVRGIDTIR